MSWFGYPMPIKGTEDAFAELASNDPSDPDHDGATSPTARSSASSTSDGKKAWDRVWTEVKA